MVVSPCDGIGAVTYTLREKLNLRIKVYGSEILEEAVRTTSSRFPHDVQLGDITKVHDDKWEEIADIAEQCGDILFSTGTPCQDNSELKGNSRKGLEGQKSSLFYECAKAKAKLEAAAKKKRVTVHTLLENVAGTHQDDINQMTKHMDTRHPIHVDAK